MAWFPRVLLLTLVFIGGCDLLDDKNKNSRLENLTVSSGVLNPAFSPDVTNYTVTVDAATASVTVTATTQKGKARVSINGGPESRKTASADVPLSVGPNAIAVVVSAEKRKKKTTYTINVTRATPTYTVGGTVSGLAGDLTLQNNGGDDLAIAADGNFTFATAIDDGSTYDVTVLTQPVGQQCTVMSGSGTLAGANVTNVSVDCVDLGFSVGGQLSGLPAAESITLQNNAGDDLVLSADGAFAFATELNDGANYDVTISVQPASQNCTVTNGSGTIAGTDITGVVVSCGALPFKVIGGIVTGLVGTSVVQLNGGSDLLLARNGRFNFTDQFTGGEAYDVTVLTQPVNQTCTVNNSSGNIGNGHVLDVHVDCTGAGVAGGSIFDWEWVNPTPQGNHVRAFASDGTTIVGVGAFGHVQTSTDGLNWTTRDSGNGTELTAIAYGNGTFVAVGFEGAFLTSSNGISWSSSFSGFNAFYGINWNGSQFVAVGLGYITNTVFGPIAATSPDGLSWSYYAVPSATTMPLWDVAWNGSVYAATVGFSNAIATSPDGMNWTTTAVAGAAVQLQEIESDGSGFVVIGNNGVVLTSPDGATWTQEANPFPGSSAADLYWDGTRYVAVSVDQFYTSADGSAWAANTVGTAGNATNPASVVRHSGVNIIGTYRGAIYTSTSDTNWTTDFQEYIQAIFNVAWHGSQFLSVGTSQTIRTSPDGVNWTTRLTGGLLSLFDVTQGGGQYVAVGFGGEALTSPDSITWTPQAQPAELASTLLQAVEWGNNLFVAVGDNKIVTSPDGVTWTVQTGGLDGTELFTDVVWNGSVWVVSGYQLGMDFIGRGYVWTSPDGVNWTRQLVGLPEYTYFESIEWNGSVFVAAWLQGLATSADGVNWSILTANTFPYKLTLSGSDFVVGGLAADILTSTDGSSWSVARSPSSALGIATSGTTTVIVTSGNTWGMITKRPPP